MQWIDFGQNKFMLS